ncbi:MAG: hypothetical protein ABIH68_01070 [bacterium]
MNKLAESRTRHFEEANADFRVCFVYFGLAFAQRIGMIGRLTDV